MPPTVQLAVDNARDFGRIAAANAISDVYAMGGKVRAMPAAALLCSHSTLWNPMHGSLHTCVHAAATAMDLQLPVVQQQEGNICFIDRH
jgi:selenophosphate synthase